MGSLKNIETAESSQIGIISGLKKTEELKKIYLDRIQREEIYRPERRVSLKKISVYIKEFDYLKGEIIVVYNPQMEVIRREMQDMLVFH